MIDFLIYGGIVLFAFCVFFIALTSMLTGKSAERIMDELKAHIAYSFMGVEGLLDDVWMRSQNKIEPIKHTGKIAVITGGTRGIGLDVIQLLLQCDMHVIMGCRRVGEGEKVLEQIRRDGIASGELSIFALDTANNASVHSFAINVRDNCPHVNYLINNAGIMFAPYKESPDGYESQFATNYLGHFLLTHLLMPLLKRGGTAQEHARIVNVSSCAHSYGVYNFEDINNKKQFISFVAYATSKMAQVHFTTYLNKVLLSEKTNVQVHAVHPGVVHTGLFENSAFSLYGHWFMKRFFKVPIEGAMPIVFATIAPQLEGKGGTYISNCQIRELSAKIKDPQIEKKLFNFTKDILKIEHFGKD